jgi:hypothetical protein
MECISIFLTAEANLGAGLIIKQSEVFIAGVGLSGLSGTGEVKEAR